jgi:hypothetical protein
VVRRLGLVPPGEAARGRQLPAAGLPATDAQVQIDGTAFAALLAGIDFTAARRGWYRRDTRRMGIDSARRM